ncbi:hypothetical protein [Nocardia nova]|uniref:hypothetical protein n=1 Tax=Nocardia nova TaxID=37330 RepID=UPI0011DC8CC7|nr:hypothetical protein [Nocardia nova]
MPTRAGALWLTSECRQLIEAIRIGLGVELIATQLQRSRSAVQARCHMLLPERLAAEFKKSEAVDLLGIELDDHPDYDWEQRLRDHAAAAGKRYWSEAMDAVLFDAWQQGRPWGEIVAATGATELEVARRCKRRGWAADLAEVADRIGFDPHGEVAAQLDPAKVWVLIIDGLHSPKQHVSVHRTRGSADITRERLIDEYIAAGGTDDQLTVTLVAGSPAGETPPRPSVVRSPIRVGPAVAAFCEPSSSSAHSHGPNSPDSHCQVGLQLRSESSCRSEASGDAARAICGCGWLGPWQPTLRQAESDVATHHREQGHSVGTPFPSE